MEGEQRGEKRNTCVSFRPSSWSARSNASSSVSCGAERGFLLPGADGVVREGASLPARAHRCDPSVRSNVRLAECCARVCVYVCELSEHVCV